MKTDPNTLSCTGGDWWPIDPDWFKDFDPDWFDEIFSEKPVNDKKKRKDNFDNEEPSCVPKKPYDGDHGP